MWKAEREKERRRGLGEKEMGKERRLLADGCQRGAEVPPPPSPVRALAVCVCLYTPVCNCVFACSEMGLRVCVFVCARLSIKLHVVCVCFRNVHMQYVCV